MKRSPTVERAIDEAVRDLASGIRAFLLGLIEAVIAPAPKPVVAPKAIIKPKAAPAKPVKKTTKPSAPSKHLSDEQMRCQYKNANGVQCKRRSKGPRYSYRCEFHLKTARKKPPAKPAPNKK